MMRKDGAASRHPPTAFFVRESLREGEVVVFPGGRQLLDMVLYVCGLLAAVVAVRIILIIVCFI